MYLACTVTFSFEAKSWISSIIMCRIIFDAKQLQALLNEFDENEFQKIPAKRNVVYFSWLGINLVHLSSISSSLSVRK